MSFRAALFGIGLYNVVYACIDGIGLYSVI